MIITPEQLLWLHRSIGQGPIDKATFIIFGNEFGCARGRSDTNSSINQFINEFQTRKLLKINEGFTVLDIDSPPVTSTFLQFISRLSLALKHEDDRFFGELSNEGKTFLNNYIMSSLYRENEAVINFRPLLQSTENHWDYENISESAYYNLYDFTTKNQKSNKLKELRVNILKEAFNLIKKESFIIGAGDKNNKKAFFETIYPEIKFSEEKLSDSYTIYFSNNIKKIILSNYFDNRTIGLGNLKLLYEFIVELKKKENTIKSCSSTKLF